MAELVTVADIPGPHPMPIIGNMRDIDVHDPLDSFLEMGREYGPIFKLQLPAGVRLFVSDPGLTHEICDDARFDKTLGGGLKTIQRSIAGTGLFTAPTASPDWVRAHEILMTPFSQQAMRGYMPRMLDIADQLMDKWTWLNPDDDIDVGADITATTLDTIALCGFGYRFNSLHRETPHPFVRALIEMLETAQSRATRPAFINRLKVRELRRAEDDQMFMRQLVMSLIGQRRAEGDAADDSDLLGRMLTGSDKHGVQLSEDNIVAQCITFLVAGHETTSGLLSFAIYELLKHPEAIAPAREQVDEVLGSSAYPTYQQVHELTRVMEILEETLRLWGPAPMFTRAPREDTVIGDRYAIPAGTPLSILVPALHRDPGVWGPDAEAFRPDRMSVENQADLPPDVYKPFGTGMRACIGRQFALQEASLLLGMILQRFELIDHMDYQLHVRTALTIKPAGLRMRVRPREGVTIERTEIVAAGRIPMPTAPPLGDPMAPSKRHGTPLYVLFGSNLGTAEGLATTLASEGVERGFTVTLGSLDDHVGDLPTDGATLIVTASYNGTPPDNAADFVKWLEDPATPAKACAGVSYAVFGCGDRSWTSTYQRIPTLVDARLEALGASRIHDRGAGDASADFDGMFEDWHGPLWVDVVRALGLSDDVAVPATSGPRLTISTTNRLSSNPVVMSYDARPTTVLDNHEVERIASDDPLARSVRHLDVRLVDGVTYAAGDHLGVLPRNGIETMRRVMRRFSLDAGSYVTIVANGGTHTHLPTDEPVPLPAILGTCVELQDVASREDVATLARHTQDEAQRAELESMTGDDEASQARFRERVADPRRSVLDLLEAFPTCDLPFADYLDLLPALRPRYYSISSSPSADPSSCSITAAVVRGPARDGDGLFRGVATNYLEAMAPRSTVFAFVRTPSIPFHPPADATIPMIMIAAGTGLAPFRGFLQERAAQQAAGRQVGPSVLFFGYRDARDYLYEDELRDLEQRGIVTVHAVSSRAPVDGRKYVQHEVAARTDEVWDLIDREGYIYVCGNARTMAPGVRAALTDLRRAHGGGSEEEAQAWITDLREQGRFVEDIWGGGGG